MKSTSTLGGILLLLCVQASTHGKDDSRFTQGLVEATRLGDTTEGKAYDNEFSRVVAPQLGDIVKECTKGLGPRVNFQVVFVFAADGHVQDVLAADDQPGAKCVGDKLRNLHLPAPPRAGWPVRLGIDINPDNASKVRELDAKFVADNLKRSREFYSKVHFVAIVNIEFPSGAVDFKYDRYPNGGPERIQSGEGADFARKNGKNWLRSDDGGETGKPVDAKTAKRLNNWVGLIEGRLNGKPAFMKFLKKDSDGDREELVYEDSNKKSGSGSQISFGRFKNSPDDEVLFSHYAGTMHLGQQDAKVDMKLGHLVAVNAVVTEHDPASPAPTDKSAGGVTLLDGKLKIDVPDDWTRESDNPKDPKTLAKFSHEGEGAAWGAVLRGTHGLTPDKLDGYLKMRVAEYTKGFNWLPKDSHLEWLKKEIVTIDGRKWADWRYVPMKKGMKDYRNNPVYTRFLTTSYKGQLLEIDFTSNLDTDPKLKAEIDHIMDSIHLEE
ncbi:MAG TPA: hypothetical protein VLK27_03350 [Chthoniobacterales bacterium]|nr:hypothetical protein [Chthoniobacterales bacterium]